MVYLVNLSYYNSMFRQTQLKINVDNYIKNAKAFGEHTKKKVMAIVKADAYGLCDYQMAGYLERSGIDFFGVSSIEEALRLRKHNIKADILVLSYAHDIEICKKNNISVIVPNKFFIAEYKDKLKDLRVHIKMNTGLNRLGILPSELNDTIKELINYGAKVEGVMTHYAKPEEEEYTNYQYKIFEEAVKNSNYNFKYIHTCASDAAIFLKDEISNYMRLGIGLLGAVPLDAPFELHNVVTLTAEVIDCKKLNKGDGVSYDHTHVSDGTGYYLTCTIGYADGLDFNYSGKEVYINGQIGTIVGKICMDLMMVRVENPCKVGDQVEIIGEHMSIDRRAKELHFAQQKVTTDISDRVTRQYYVNGKLEKEINYRFD